jgi:hypothetical protein
MEAPPARKKGKDFTLGHFYIILNLEVRRKHMSLQSPLAFRPGGGAGQIPAYTCVNSQVPHAHEEGNFHSSLTKGLQLKWSSLGSEVMVREGVQGAVNQPIWS